MNTGSTSALAMAPGGRWILGKAYIAPWILLHSIPSILLSLAEIVSAFFFKDVKMSERSCSDMSYVLNG